MNKYVNSYTGLRAIAMLGVLFYHVFPNTFPGGYLGVIIFFVLAGFLGYVSVDDKLFGLKKKRVPNAIGLEIANRLKRLLPELFFMVCISMLFMLFIFPNSIKINLVSVWGSLSFTNNITQIFEGQSYFDQIGILKPFTHIWALSMEFQFHIMLCFFFLFSYGRKNPGLTKIILFLICIFSYFYMKNMIESGVDMTRVYYDPFARVFSYAFGALFGFFIRGLKRKMADYSGVLSIMLIGFLGASFFVFGISDVVFQFIFLIYSIVSALLLFLLYYSNSPVSQCLSHPVLQEIGKRSYSLYLWHYPILKFMDKIFAHIGIPSFLYYILYFIITILISEFSYRLFSQDWSEKMNSGVKKLTFVTALSGIFLLSAFAMWQKDSTQLELMKNTILENEKLMIEKNQQNTDQNEAEKSEAGEEKAVANISETQTVESRDSQEEKEQEVSSEYSSLALSDFKFLNSEVWNKIIKFAPDFKWKKKLSVFMIILYGKDHEKKEKEFYDFFKPKENIQKQISETPPVEKSASHKKADTYVEYVNGFGDKVFMDIDQYAKYRLTKMLIIGDSIASMSYHTLALYMPEAIIDGEHSRQFTGAYDTYMKYLNQGEIGDFVVLALGTNGAVNPADIDRVHEKLNGRKLILISIVLPYKAEEESRNKEIIAYADKYDDVYLVDWHAVAKGQKKWFFEDNIHPGENGAKVYSQLIMKKIIEIIEGY